MLRVGCGHKWKLVSWRLSLGSSIFTVLCLVSSYFSVSAYLIHLSKLLYSHFPLSSKQVAEYVYIYIYIYFFFFFLTEILKCNGAWWWLLTRLLWLSSVARHCDSQRLLREIPNTICDLPKIFNTVLLDW